MYSIDENSVVDSSPFVLDPEDFLLRHQEIPEAPPEEIKILVSASPTFSAPISRGHHTQSSPLREGGLLNRTGIRLILTFQ